MTDLRKAAEQALEILDMCFYDEEDEVYCLGGWHQEKFMDAREALRQALAQPNKEWVGLSEDDRSEIRRSGSYSVRDKDFQAIEDKLREKNVRRTRP